MYASRRATSSNSPPLALLYSVRYSVRSRTSSSSRSSFRRARCARIRAFQSSFVFCRAPAFPFRVPAPDLCPYERFSARSRARPRELVFASFSRMVPCSMSSRTSSRVMASSISSCASGSSQTRPLPTSSSSAASRFCSFRSLIVDLHFDVGRVQHANLALLRLVFDQFALATADLRGDPHRLRVAVDALEVVRVVDADFLEAARVEVARRRRRAEAGLDDRPLRLHATALLGEPAARLAPRRRDPLFLVVVLPVELRFALAVLLCERASGLVVQGRRLIGVAAGA